MNQIRQAIYLAVLMVLSPWAAADIATWQGPDSSPDDAGISHSNSTYEGFEIPTNSTITGSQFSICLLYTSPSPRDDR